MNIEIGKQYWVPTNDGALEVVVTGRIDGVYRLTTNVGGTAVEIVSHVAEHIHETEQDAIRDAIRHNFERIDTMAQDIQYLTAWTRTLLEKLRNAT